MALDLGDKASALFKGLSDFWKKFFRDTVDLEAFYQASELYLGEVYLDFLSSVLNIGLVDTPVFNKEYWKLFAVREDELSFVEGYTLEDDRFVYDMPGAAVRIDFLQNTIFAPDVLLERDVDFEVLNDDGYIRFREDPFRSSVDAEGQVFPLHGLAWRYVELEVGNRFTDLKRTTSWYDDTNVRRGDILRLVGRQGVLKQKRLFSDGQIIYLSSTHIRFSSSTYTGFVNTNVGDLIKVVNGPSEVYEGLFIIKEVLSTSLVRLEPTTYIPTTSSGAGSLDWELYKGVYFEDFIDYRVDYIDDTYLVGDKDTPYTLDYSGPLMYAVVRDVFAPDVEGIALTEGSIDKSSDVTAATGTVTIDSATSPPTVYVTMSSAVFESYMTAGSSPADFYWLTIGSNGNDNQGTYKIQSMVGSPTVKAYIGMDPADAVDGETFTDWNIAQTFPVTDLGHRQIKKGTFVAHARRYWGGVLVEDVDYSIDYLRGTFVPLKIFDLNVVHTCSFEVRREVVFSVGGMITEQTMGRVKQVSFWVPEVAVDRFNLYYTYGVLLNKFEASSESYKAFLRGILYLYVSGPVFQRVEAALNVAADLPVVRNDNELLVAYSDGIIASNTDGEFVDAATDPMIPYPHFITTSYVFTEVDVGGYIVISNALEDINNGRFRIANILSAGVVEVETPYGVKNESALVWVYTRTYGKTVTTSANTYVFPFNVPMREDVEDSASLNRLTFSAFEPLTEAFTVTDYVEDPSWWHNKHIPSQLWPEQSGPRRLATTKLYENIIGPQDDARIGDPGLYLGADDEGNVVEDITHPAARHSAAFILFDRYVKFHLFYIRFSPDLELDQEFVNDLSELIVVAKPTYTDAFIEPTRPLDDLLALMESFQESFGFSFGSDEALTLPDTKLLIGGPDNFRNIGDYSRYVNYTATAAGVASPPGGAFDLPVAGTPPAKQHVIKLRLNATISGVQVEEGVDYTFDYDPTSVPVWRVTPITVWDVAVSVTFDALVIEVVNLADVATPDTTLGFTPIFLGGTDPGHVRKDITVVSAVSEEIDRTLSLKIDIGGGTPYTYP